MPIDYSKFDSIDDSDEEPASKAPTFAPPARTQDALAKPAEKKIGRNGREVLDGMGLENKLTVFGGGGSSASAAPAPGSQDTPEMSALATAMEQLASQGGYGKGSGKGPEEPPKPGEPQRMIMRADGRKKIHTTFPDGSEMVEEFDERTDVVVLRKTRKPTTLGGEAAWVFEVGQAPEAPFDPHADLMRASQSNPIFLRKDTPEHFQWRVRNLVYPANVYSVSVDHEKQEVVVRTSNKKYYKRIQVPDLARIGLKLKDDLLTWKHQHNTLIISYNKPAEFVEEERKALKQAEQLALKV
eukprot:CAMPEP_0197627274 /NCGR_PEP_ID=MMETSP1338-20131121/5931_1 /TAXON_ID=43686 ORGANISM="Pelagodinium beii, Strain RCC1491" /NCGR_SAMPLE_ID=MMETSP1338 /ASSEMBLY_ACC=CAM_ASM_000754 /LENGTH=297 /DNA_ID=CAMNT_0043197957 /DNA_START=47 /DNA_END=940 /DNA_ORIENTATION=+